MNPRSQVVSIGAEREVMRGLFAGADYVHQHWTDLDRTVDLNAPTPFDRTAPGQTRTVAAANATRPILPVNGGVRSVNVLMNLGVADYDGLQTQVSYRGNPKMYANVSYTLSKATNTTEPDGNGIAPNESNISQLGEEERGPSVVDQRHRAVISFWYHAAAQPHGRHRDAAGVGAAVQLDDRHRQQRRRRQQRSPGGRRRRIAQVGVSRHRDAGRLGVRRGASEARADRHPAAGGRLQPLQSREHPGPRADDLRRYRRINPTFGQVVAVGTATNALPSLANIDPPRMLQLQVRFQLTEGRSRR